MSVRHLISLGTFRHGPNPNWGSGTVNYYSSFTQDQLHNVHLLLAMWTPPREIVIDEALHVCIIVRMCVCASFLTRVPLYTLACPLRVLFCILPQLQGTGLNLIPTGLFHDMYLLAGVWPLNNYQNSVNSSRQSWNKETALTQSAPSLVSLMVS